MFFRTQSNMLFRLFCLLTAQGGSVLAAIRFIFENCHNLKQKTEVVKPFLAFTSVFLFGGCATAPFSCYQCIPSKWYLRSFPFYKFSGSNNNPCCAGTKNYHIKGIKPDFPERCTLCGHCASSTHGIGLCHSINDIFSCVLRVAHNSSVGLIVFETPKTGVGVEPKICPCPKTRNHVLIEHTLNRCLICNDHPLESPLFA